MQCFYRKFLQKGRFVFQHEAGAEHSGASKKEPESKNKPEDKAGDKIAKALTACSEFSCSLELPEKPWQKEADRILGEIQQDANLRLAFNTFLQDYARAFGKDAFEITDDASSNFYMAIQAVGVPDSAVGFNTAWNDVLHYAKKGVAESKEKWPYEKLKTIIDGVKDRKKPTQIAQK